MAFIIKMPIHIHTTPSETWSLYLFFQSPGPCIHFFQNHINSWILSKEMLLKNLSNPGLVPPRYWIDTPKAYQPSISLFKPLMKSSRFLFLSVAPGGLLTGVDLGGSLGRWASPGKASGVLSMATGSPPGRGVVATIGLPNTILWFCLISWNE